MTSAVLELHRHRLHIRLCGCIQDELSFRIKKKLTGKESNNQLSTSPCIHNLDAVDKWMDSKSLNLSLTVYSQHFK